MNAFDVDEQIGPLTVRPLAHRTLMSHLLVDALHVRRQHFPGIIHLLAVDALEFSLDVLDEAVIAQSVFPGERSAAFIAGELLMQFVRVLDVLLHFRGEDEFAANFARTFLRRR